VPENAHQVFLHIVRTRHRLQNRLSGTHGQRPYHRVVISLALVELVLLYSFQIYASKTDFQDEPVTSYIQVGSGLAFGSRPSTPPRRSNDNDSWNSSDLRGPTWGELVAPFSTDDVNLSPRKQRVGDMPRSTSPFHALQETRHRQATAAQAAALGHNPDSGLIEDSRSLNDNSLGDRSRGRSLDMDQLARNNENVDVFHPQQIGRNPRPFEANEPSGRSIRANILGGLDEDYSRNHPVSRTRVHTLDPSFSLEPLQRANSTPPYSGPVPISSRDLPQSGLNPYPQSRTPQLQSSGHFTTSSPHDHLSKGLRDLSLDSRSKEVGRSRIVSSNSALNNVGAGYSTGMCPRLSRRSF